MHGITFEISGEIGDLMASLLKVQEKAETD
jgi:hypothetical protein